MLGAPSVGLKPAPALSRRSSSSLPMSFVNTSRTLASSSGVMISDNGAWLSPASKLPTEPCVSMAESATFLETVLSGFQ